MTLEHRLLGAYSRLMRLIGPNSGLTSLSFNRPLNHLFSKLPRDLTASLSDGTKIRINSSDYHGRILWVFGCNDFKVSRTVNSLLARGDVFLDIGANYSTIGLLARHSVGAEGHVHLFEPQPHLATIVREAIAAAGLGDRVTLHDVALLDADGTFEMAVPGHHSGMATLVTEGRDTGAWTRFPVAARNTHAYLAPLVQDRPFGVKIDVEGAELPILRDLVRFPGLKFLVFEGNHNLPALHELMREGGFHVWGLERTVLRVRLARVGSFPEWKDFHDFLAIRRDIRSPGRSMALKDLAARFHAPGGLAAQR